VADKTLQNIQNGKPFMGIGKLLFVIPIYYRSPRQHSDDYKRKYSKYLESQKKLWNQVNKNLFDERLKEDPNCFFADFQNKWYSWNYTQIIAFVEIYFDGGTMIKASLWKLDKKRHRPVMKKKVFKYVPKLSDVARITNRDNNFIKEKINKFLKYLQKRYKNRYVDISQIENILPLINFEKLTKSKR